MCLPPLLLLLLLVPACGQITSEPPLDAQGKPIPLPQTYDTWLEATLVSPPPGTTLLPSLPQFTVRYNAYLDPDTFLSYSGPSLATGGIFAAGDPLYAMSTRSLYWTPNQPLRPGFEYTWSYDYTGLKSITHAPTPPAPAPLTLRFLVDPDAPPPPPAPIDLDLPPVFWPQIQALFDAKGCGTCHGQPSWNALVPLTYEALLNQPSRQHQGLLVLPLDPRRSVLMHKLLPDYPLEFGQRQPPPWAPEGANLPLDTQELWQVERWILGGAKRE